MAFYGRTFGQVLKESALEALFGIKPSQDDKRWADLPYASGINGADRIMAKILRVEGVMHEAMLGMLEKGSHRVRMAAAQMVDQDSGRLREILLHDQAVFIDTKNAVAYVGFRKEARAAFSANPHRRRKKPSRLHNEGIYAVWVNSGRKGYAAGDLRASGKDRRGKVRMRKVARTTGAMAGSHFLERALDMYRPYIQQLREQALREAIHIRLGAGRRT